MRGDRLKEAREALKLSQKDLSELTGVNSQHIYRLEAGKYTNPTADTLIKIAHALGVSIDWILGVDEHDEPLTENTLQPDERRLLAAYRQFLPY